MIISLSNGVARVQRPMTENEEIRAYRHGAAHRVHKRQPSFKAVQGRKFATVYWNLDDTGLVNDLDKVAPIWREFRQGPGGCCSYGLYSGYGERIPLNRVNRFVKRIRESCIKDDDPSCAPRIRGDQ